MAIKFINYGEVTRITLGLKAPKNNMPFSIKIHQLKDIPEDVNIYVFDKVDNTYTDVKKNCFRFGYLQQSF